VRAPQLARACLGYVMQERGVDLYLSARENLEVLAGLYHLPRPAIGQRVEEALRQVGLAERADEPVERFSGGMKKRLEIAGGLLHRPRVLLLDEPTLGLDVQTRQHIWESIRRLRAEGMTVLLTTHYLEEADQLCDRIAIIDGGRVRAQGSPAELKAHLGTDRLSIRLAPGRATAPVAAVLAGLAGARPRGRGGRHRLPAADPGGRVRGRDRPPPARRGGGMRNMTAEGAGLPAAGTRPPGGLADAYQEVAALTLRWVRRLRREPTSIVVSLLQPVLWLVLFGNLFGRAGTLPGVGGSYLAFMTAGVVVMTVFNNALAGGVEVLFDKETGLLQRFLAAPVRRGSLLVSRFLFVLGLTGAQALVILAGGRLLGVHVATGLGGVLVILGVGFLLGTGVATLSLTLAFVIRHHGDFFTLLSFITLPLLFISTALAPRAAMPGWMAALAGWNPMTYAIDAVRALVLDGWAWGLVGRMAAALAAFDALMLAVGLAVFRRALD
jgi:ABC-2 type transport system permease protein